MTVVGTRPEIIRLSRIIAALDAATEHVFVHTGQNYDYELNGIFFEDLELRAPDAYLDAAGETAAETIARVIAAADRVMRERRPDAVLILGDTNSSLAAIAAKRLRIPVFHMEAGNRCFDERVPEEVNRRIVDHISDVNLPYSAISREYLLREGIAPDRIIATGSPMMEVLTHYRPKIDASTILNTLGLERHEYYVVSAHREENVDDDQRFDALLGTLNTVAETFQRPMIVSTHPRTRNLLGARSRSTHALIQFVKPLGFTDYVRLQLDARAVLSDSGTITEESSILGFPALNIRDAHERPEGMEEAAVILTGVRPDAVLRGLAECERQLTEPAYRLQVVEDYRVPNVSWKVVRILLSYTAYVRQKVWHEPGA
jgi:UDP-N-acetylglucosamine 2-epimerase